MKVLKRFRAFIKTHYKGVYFETGVRLRGAIYFDGRNTKYFRKMFITSQKENPVFYFHIRDDVYQVFQIFHFDGYLTGRVIRVQYKKLIFSLFFKAHTLQYQLLVKLVINLYEFSVQKVALRSV